MHDDIWLIIHYIRVFLRHKETFILKNLNNPLVCLAIPHRIAIFYAQPGDLTGDLLEMLAQPPTIVLGNTAINRFYLSVRFHIVPNPPISPDLFLRYPHQTVSIFNMLNDIEKCYFVKYCRSQRELQRLAKKFGIKKTDIEELRTEIIQKLEDAIFNS